MLAATARRAGYRTQALALGGKQVIREWQRILSEGATCLDLAVIVAAQLLECDCVPLLVLRFGVDDGALAAPGITYSSCSIHGAAYSRSLLAHRERAARRRRCRTMESADHSDRLLGVLDPTALVVRATVRTSGSTSRRA